MKNFAAPRGLGRESVGMTVVSTVPDFFTVEEAAAILRPVSTSRPMVRAVCRSCG
jgi:hypothetical protein